MTSYELVKTIFLVFIIIAIGSISNRYNKAIEAEGLAKQKYLSTYQNLDVSAEEARYFLIGVSLFDVAVVR